MLVFLSRGEEESNPGWMHRHRSKADTRAAELSSQGLQGLHTHWMSSDSSALLKIVFSTLSNLTCIRNGEPRAQEGAVI